MNLVPVTGIGAWPGSDVSETAKLIRDTCLSFPHIAELPERGAGADMIGRTMSLVSAVSEDFSVETIPTGWQLSRGRGRDIRRADSYLGEDLDVFEEVFTDYTGDFKIHVVGPWSLAAEVEGKTGAKLVGDPGVVRDLTQALAQALQLHIADVQRRIPGATLTVQIDEPHLREVLRGSVKTQSGWSAYRAVDTQIVQSGLEIVREAANRRTVVHCCAQDVPFAEIRGAGFDGYSFDVSLVGSAANDWIGERIDAGGFVMLGLAPTSVKAGVAQIEELRARIGFNEEQWNAHVVLTPPCDLIDMSLSEAHAKIDLLNKVSRVISGSEDS